MYSTRTRTMLNKHYKCNTRRNVLDKILFWKKTHPLIVDESEEIIEGMVAYTNYPSEVIFADVGRCDGITLHHVAVVENYVAVFDYTTNYVLDRILCGCAFLNIVEVRERITICSHKKNSGKYPPTISPGVKIKFYPPGTPEPEEGGFYA